MKNEKKKKNKKKKKKKKNNSYNNNNQNSNHKYSSNKNNNNNNNKYRFLYSKKNEIKILYFLFTNEFIIISCSLGFVKIYFIEHAHNHIVLIQHLQEPLLLEKSTKQLNYLLNYLLILLDVIAIETHFIKNFLELYLILLHFLNGSVIHHLLYEFL